MKLFLKIIGWICISLAGTITIMVIALLLINDEQYKEWITAAASSATGRELKITGKLKVHFGSNVNIMAENISFSNATWGKRDEMITVDRLFLNLNLLPLLRGVVDFTLEVDKPDILLEKNKEGKGNWTFVDSHSTGEQVVEPEAEQATVTEGLPFKPFIRNLECKNLTLVFSSGLKDKEIVTKIETLKIHTGKEDIPLSLIATYQHIPIELKGTLGRIADWNNNRETEISLQGKFNEAQFAVDGSLGPLFPKPDAQIKLSIYTQDFSTFSPFIGKSLSQLKELGSLQIDGNIIYSDQSLKLDAVHVQLEKLGLTVQADAAIKDVESMAGVESRFEINLDSLAHLTPVTGEQLPAAGPWKLNLDVTTKEMKSSPMTVSAELEGEGINTQVNATLPDITRPGTINAKLSMATESISNLGVLFNKELPDDGPVKITANVSAQPGELRVDTFLALLKDARISADVAYTVPKESESEIPQLNGKVKIENLNLQKLLPPTKEAPESINENPENIAETESDTANEEEPTGRKLFSKEPLAFGALQGYNIDFKLETVNFIINSEFTIEGGSSVSLNDGLLTLGPLNLKGERGGVGEGLVVLDASGSEAKLDVFVDLEDFVSPKFGGKFDLYIELVGNGKSIADLMAGLDGKLFAAINDVELEESWMTKFGSGMFQNMNPLGSNTVMLECAIVRIDVADGMADFTDKIAAQTTEVTWYGSGEINLKTEEVNLGIHPKPRKKFSSLTNVGLAELVQVRGTLAEPKIGIDAKDAAVKYATIGAHISTGGLSFLAEKYFENRKANMAHCLQILAETEKE